MNAKRVERTNQHIDHTRAMPPHPASSPNASPTPTLAPQSGMQPRDPGRASYSTLASDETAFEVPTRSDASGEVPVVPDTIHDVSAFVDDDDEDFEEETRVSSPLRLLTPSEKQKVATARHAHDEMPTRAFVRRGESSRPIGVGDRIGRDRTPTSATAPAPVPHSSVNREAGRVPSVLVDHSWDAASNTQENTPNPLDVDRALLRVITAPRMVTAAVAIHPGDTGPSRRTLVAVAIFSALGMLWVMAVSAMIVVLLTR